VTPNEPLVSVVIPCHNYARFVGEAIDSVLTQTHRSIEVIVVDDGSSDDTVAVAKRYPVRLLEQPHLGVCVATNNGIRASRGQYIMRLDADDILAPAYVEETLAALMREPGAALAYADGTYVGTRNGPVPLQPFDVESLAEGAYAPCLALMRRSSCEQVGGYDVRLTPYRCEDWDMWLSFAERGMTGVLVRKPLWFYRKHGRSRVRAVLSLAGLEREYGTIAHLQDKHPQLFSTRKLIRRLARLPGRLWRRDVSLRFAMLLTTFYAVMLARTVLLRTGHGRAELLEAGLR
jgi:glycosyltransferase involved in cell wall biosynthesis